MNLVVDCGNTKMKVGVFDQYELVKVLVLDNGDEDNVLSLTDVYDIDYAILSSVSVSLSKLAKILSSKLKNVLLLSSDTKLPIKNLYRTPKTLGTDRLAVAVAADMLSPEGAPSLVIDAGTAVTYEFVTAHSEYVGGNIAPGLAMRFRALNAFTHRLPLLEKKENVEPIGNDTESAIQAGVIEGMTFEIDGYIEKYTQQNPNLCVFLTGGDAFFFEKRLKNRTLQTKTCC